MRTLLRTAAVTAAVVAAGCGTPTATLKGKLVDGASPVTTDGQLVSVSFHPLNGGTPDPNVIYAAVVNPDGTFEFVASGGTLPPGDYRVVVAAAGSPGPPDPKGKPAKKKSDRPDKFASCSTLAVSKITVKVSAGANDLTVDLSKPSG